MTPKEKAIELVKKYSFVEIANYTSIHEVKECALIAVNEMISNMPYGFYSGIRPNYKGTDLEYWQEVKQEIEKL